jgi:hypothetical protein
MASQTNRISRQEFSFNMTEDTGRKLRIRMMDRINIDDLVIHLIHRELHTIVTGTEHDVDVPKLFKESVINERFVTR